MDIDIDLADDTAAKELFKGQLTLASRVENNELVKHLVGVYFQEIPEDPITGLAAVPCIVSGEEPRRDRALELGYFKIDFLHLDLLSKFKSKKEMRTLLRTPPDWSMLENPEIVKRIFHIHRHFDLVYQVRPTSVDQLADILMLIRPNKIGLLHKYLKNPADVKEELCTKRDKTDLRLSHAIPYAMLIVLNMHLLKRELDGITTRDN